MALKLCSANSVGCRAPMPKEGKKKEGIFFFSPSLADFQLKKSMLEKNIAGGQALLEFPNYRIHNEEMELK